MFPLVPFSNRLGDDVTIGGERRALPRYIEDCALAIHGFGWKQAWTVEESNASALNLLLCDKQSPWPSAYQAEQSFELNPQGFQASLKITNIGEEALPAGIGFHPYFPRGDCELMIGLDMMWEQDERGLPLKSMPSGWDGCEYMPLELCRLDHSFSGWDGVAEMRWPSRNLTLELTADEALRELVIYSPDEDYFCVEPVSHLTNAMFAADEERRRGWRVLAPGEKLEGSITLRAGTID